MSSGRQRAEFVSNSRHYRARIMETEAGDIVLTLDTRDGLGGAIVISKQKLTKFAEFLGWSKERVENM